MRQTAQNPRAFPLEGVVAILILACAIFFAFDAFRTQTRWKMTDPHRSSFEDEEAANDSDTTSLRASGPLPWDSALLL